MKIIIIIAVVVIAILAAGFVYVIYKTGENMHMHRCGWRKPHDRGFM